MYLLEPVSFDTFFPQILLRFSWLAFLLYRERRDFDLAWACISLGIKHARSEEPAGAARKAREPGMAPRLLPEASF